MEKQVGKASVCTYLIVNKQNASRKLRLRWDPRVHIDLTKAINGYLSLCPPHASSAISCFFVVCSCLDSTCLSSVSFKNQSDENFLNQGDQAKQFGFRHGVMSARNLNFVTVGCASSTAHKMNLNLFSFAVTRGFHVKTISTRIRFKTYNSCSHFEFISILEFPSYKSFTRREVRCLSFPRENRHRPKIT